MSLAPRVTDGQDRLGRDREWVWRYLMAAHGARAAVAGFALYVAARTTEEIPVAGWFSVALAAIGLVWVLTLAAFARPLDRLVRRRRGLIWADAAVLMTLSLLNKPWDAMVAVPFGAFLLLVIYGTPRGILALTVLMSLLQYVPKLVLEAVDWRYAELCPPTSSAEWMTAYVGPVFAGTICWALCVLVAGVRRASGEWELAQLSLTEAEIRRADLRARRAVADRLHETISQVVRAIPLRLDSDSPPAVGDEAQQLRSRITELALQLRPSVQRAARTLRDGERDDGGSKGAIRLPR